MDRDADLLRSRLEGRPSLEEVLVPVFHTPARGRGRDKAGQRERRRKHVLAEAGVGVLRIEGVDQERVAALDESTGLSVIENRCNGHLAGDPAFGDGVKEGLIGCDHGCTLSYKVLHVSIPDPGYRSEEHTSELQ